MRSRNTSDLRGTSTPGATNSRGGEGDINSQNPDTAPLDGAKVTEISDSIMRLRAGCCFRSALLQQVLEKLVVLDERLTGYFRSGVHLIEGRRTPGQLLPIFSSSAPYLGGGSRTTHTSVPQQRGYSFSGPGQGTGAHHDRTPPTTNSGPRTRDHEGPENSIIQSTFAAATIFSWGADLSVDYDLEF